MFRQSGYRFAGKSMLSREAVRITRYGHGPMQNSMPPLLRKRLGPSRT
jgi:hypothetical protein